jgi:hypothetical protein
MLAVLEILVGPCWAGCYTNSTITLHICLLQCPCFLLHGNIFLIYIICCFSFFTLYPICLSIHFQIQIYLLAFCITNNPLYLLLFYPLLICRYDCLMLLCILFLQCLLLSCWHYNNGFPLLLTLPI